MAVTKADLDALEKAYAAGIRSVSEGGRTVLYDSGDAMERRIDWMKAQLSRRPLSFNRKARFSAE